jgi:ABC-type glycerol-3-phosphate transport system substrate-binding protein
MDEKVVFDNTSSGAGSSSVGQPPPPPEVAPPQPLQPPPPVSGGMPKNLLIAGVVGVVLLLAFLIFLFIPKKQSLKDVNLVWWGLWEDERIMQPLITDYEKQHPNVHIKYIKKTPQDYRDTLTLRIKNGSGNAPDIFRYHNTWLPMLLSAGIIAPLSSDVITPEEFKKDYYPVMQADLVRNGGIYGIPLSGDTLALFINTQIFKDAGMNAPANWENFITTAKKLTKKDPDTQKIKVAGAALGLYDNITHAPDIISLLFAQQGVDLQGLKDNDKEMGALRYYINNFGRKDKENVWDETLANSKLAFAEGKLAMYFGYSWDVFDIQEKNQNLAFGIYPVPANYQRNNSIASYWVEGVSSKSPNQKEALAFMHYLAQKETEEKFYTEAAKVRDFGEPYARVDLADTLKDNKIVYPFVSQLKDAKSTIFSSSTWDGETGMNSKANVYLGKAVKTILDDASSADTAVQTLNDGVAQILGDYGIQQQ